MFARLALYMLKTFFWDIYVLVPCCKGLRRKFFSFSCPRYNPTGWQHCALCFREPNCKLRSLNVSKCLLGGLDAGCLGETIRKARNLDALRAAGASRPADVMPLVLALTEAPCLQLLDLSSPRLALDDHPSRLLCHALARNTTLKLLSLEGWTFRIEVSVCETLRHYSRGLSVTF